MRNEKNFWELLIHHVGTVIAILFSYFTNFEDYGPFVLIASDISDAILNIGKVCRDIFGETILLDIIFFLAMTSWFLSRNIFLLGCLVRSSFGTCFWKLNLEDPKYIELW